MLLRPFDQKTDRPKRDRQSYFRFEFGWAAAPHPEKAWKGGEDAIYASGNLLIVADGVSGWHKFGIDAGVYARKLV